MVVTFLNLGSLILGLIAWALPSVGIGRYKKNNHKNWALFPFASMSACAVSICFQLIYQNHMADIGDTSAIYDTIGASVTLSLILLISTIVLNLINLFIYHERMSS